MKAGKPGEIPKSLIAGIVANFLVAVSKMVAFVFTGSAAMLAESLHSAADSSNQMLLAVGIKRSIREPDESHPFGYSKESYFWAFIVAILIFLMGGAFAIYEGIHKFMDPEPMENVIWNYGALGLAMIFESYALRVAFLEFSEWRRHNPGGLLDNLRDTKDPTLPTVLFEDTAALAGLIVATVGIAVSQLSGDARWDGAASVTIGLILLIVAGFLARESHSLIIGEAASPKHKKMIRRIVGEDADVDAIGNILTLHMGPTHIMVALAVDFNDTLDTQGLEQTISRLDESIREAVPEAQHIFIEASSITKRKLEK